MAPGDAGRAQNDHMMLARLQGCGVYPCGILGPHEHTIYGPPVAAGLPAELQIDCPSCKRPAGSRCHTPMDDGTDSQWTHDTRILASLGLTREVVSGGR